MLDEKKPLFAKKEKDEKLQENRTEFLNREFANSSTDFVEYGKKFLPKHHYFMVMGDEIVYLPTEKIEINDVFVSDEAKLQITITSLLPETYTFNPFGSDKLQLVCNKAKFK